MDEPDDASCTRWCVHVCAHSGCCDVGHHVAVADGVVVGICTISCHSSCQPAHLAVAGYRACHGHPLQCAGSYHGSGDASRRSFAGNVHILENQVPHSRMVHPSEESLEGCGVLNGQTLYGMTSAVQDAGEACRVAVVLVRCSDRHPFGAHGYLYVAGKVVVLRQVLADGIQLFVAADGLGSLQRRVFGVLGVHQHPPVALFLHPAMQLLVHRLNPLLMFGRFCQVVEFPRVGLVVVELDGRAMDKLAYKPIGPLVRLRCL